MALLKVAAEKPEVVAEALSIYAPAHRGKPKARHS